MIGNKAPVIVNLMNDGKINFPIHLGKYCYEQGYKYMCMRYNKVTRRLIVVFSLKPIDDMSCTKMQYDDNERAKIYIKNNLQSIGLEWKSGKYGMIGCSDIMIDGMPCYYIDFSVEPFKNPPVRKNLTMSVQKRLDKINKAKKAKSVRAPIPNRSIEYDIHIRSGKSFILVFSKEMVQKYVSPMKFEYVSCDYNKDSNEMSFQFSHKVIEGKGECRFMTNYYSGNYYNSDRKKMIGVCNELRDKISHVIVDRDGKRVNFRVTRVDEVNHTIYVRLDEYGIIPSEEDK